MSLTICQTSDLTMLPPYNEFDSVSIDEFFQNRWNDFKDITKNVASFISKKLEDIKQINMIISGTTGSGKSTLINNLFRGNICRTGIGKPITHKIRQKKINNIPLTIYDTPGIELDAQQQEQLKNDMYNLIEEKAQMNDINESIHCILYCVNCETGRFQSEEENFIRNFVDNPRIGNIPVILVLTQCYDDDKRDEMMVELNNMNLNVKQIVPVVAKARTFNIRGVKIDCHQYGLDILIEVIENCLPNILKESLHNVQIASVKLKNKAALKTIAFYVPIAASMAASPIPFSDCYLLVPTEILMLTSITIIYGVEIPTGFMVDFLSSTIGCGTATLLGKSVVASLLKFIPGAGTIIGGTISGGIAAALTTALGNLYIQIIEKIYNGEYNIKSMDHEQFKQIVSTMYKKNLKKEPC